MNHTINAARWFGAFFIPALAICLTYTSATGVLAASIVVPNGLETTDGDFAGPFSMGDYRSQALLMASQFPGPVLITGTLMRPDVTQSSSASISFTDHTVFVSTTSKTLATLSSTFADNIGPDNTLVYSGPLAIHTDNIPGPGTAREFDLYFPWTTPFLYDPSQGNLLIDAHVVGSTGDPLIIDIEASTPAGKGVFAAGSANAASGDVFDFFVVGQINFEVIPEPSSLATFAAGTLALLGFAWRRARAKSRRVACFRAA